MHWTRLTLAFAAAAALLVPACAARERASLDRGWRLHFGHAADPDLDFGFGKTAWFSKAMGSPGPARPDFPDSGWRRVDVPHDWAVELPFVPDGNGDVVSHGSKPVGRAYPATSVGWYRKAFDVPASDRGRRLSLEFDGVFRDSAVWVNGAYMGREESGYSPFRYDITDVANYGGRNVVTVRVDASQYEGWFYEGAGIYRHVWLVKTSPVHVPQWGTFVTSRVEGSRATVSIATEIANDSGQPATVDVESVVTSPAGARAATIRTAGVRLGPWQRTTVRQAVRLAGVALWSPDRPAMYRLQTVLRQGGEAVDSVDTPFGVRTIRFDPDRGFLLNGQRVEIKGTCNHQDHAGVGAALPDAIQDYRIRRLKEMGSNAYRTSHNAPTPELVDACDRLGMLVMDEQRLMGSSPEVLSQLSRMVRRDRNHPSVILWSLGNEENALNTTETGQRIAETMRRTVRDLDTTRPTTYAGNNGNQWTGPNAAVDVRGWNYFTNGSLDEYHKAHPRQPMVGSEEASTLSTRGEYANDRARSVMSAYDVNQPGWGAMAEQWWTAFAARPYMAGAFVWTGFDYRGEPTPYGWPAISSQFGILDTCGFPKDNFYYYQAWWTSRPVLHILPHWTWPGREGQPIAVWVHGNAERVDLLLNGRSLGTKPMPRNGHLEWSVRYEPGVLEAKGFSGGRQVSSDRVETAGPPAKIVLEPDRDTLRADGADVAMVTFSIRDAAGRVVPGADSEVRFDAAGGRILGVGNGNPQSHEPDRLVTEPAVREIGGWEARAAAPDEAARADRAREDSRWRNATVTDDIGDMERPGSAVYWAEFEVAPEDIRRGGAMLEFGQIDDLGVVYVNGVKVAETNDWRRSYAFDVSSVLKPGRNVVTVFVTNTDGRGGLAGGVRLTGPEPALDWRRRAFHGLGQVIVQSPDTAGSITLSATSPGLAGASLTIRAVPAPAAPPRL